MYNKQSGLKANDLRKVELSQNTKDILAGTLLGDGHLAKSTEKYYLSMHHCKKQLDYMVWKAENMPELFIQPLPIQYRSETNSYQVRSISRSDLSCFLSLEYLLENLNLVSIGVWYGDDGCKWKDRKSPVSVFELGARSEEASKRIRDRMIELGFDCYLLNRQRKYWRLMLKNEASGKLQSSVYFLPKCMHYKLKDASETIRQALKSEDIVRPSGRPEALIGICTSN